MARLRKQLRCLVIHSLGRLTSLAVVVLFLGAIAGVGAGYYLAHYQQSSKQHRVSDDALRQQIVALKEIIEQDRKDLMQAQVRAENEINAMALRVGSLQAQLFRLEAVGERLVETAGLDSSEFMFDETPGVGGADSGEFGQGESAASLITQLDLYEQQLRDQEQKLALIEGIVLTKGVKRATLPSGLPVKNGWISSGFGMRIHPITGVLKKHAGVDIPGKRGTPVYAVAPGIVVKAKASKGYGKLVELRHADGYLTRYGHNSKLLVSEGDYIKKGQKIAMIGSTGFSTGPHLHFEVLKNGTPVNPASYIESNKQ